MYSVLFGREARYLRVFGSLCYAHENTGDKFASQSRRCFFAGYTYGKKGWKLYDMKMDKYIISPDVIFCEYEFSFAPQLSGHMNTPYMLVETGIEALETDEALELRGHREY